jgi:chaperone modulatory protein CbpM
MDLDAVARLFPNASLLEITSWVERGWVQPDEAGGQLEFAAIDIARVRLICDLRHDMALGEEAIPVVLSLLDQVYELRGQLRRVLGALETQPDSVRQSLRDVLRDRV